MATLTANPDGTPIHFVNDNQSLEESLDKICKKNLQHLELASRSQALTKAQMETLVMTLEIVSELLTHKDALKRLEKGEIREEQLDKAGKVPALAKLRKIRNGA